MAPGSRTAREGMRLVSPLSLAWALTLLLCPPRLQASSFNYSHVGLDWGGLCASGEFQSPINIVRSSVTGCSDSLSISYQVTKNYTLVNTGHTINLLPEAGSQNTVTFNSQTYSLVQLHAHAVSEHTFDGFFGAMEFHYVHRNTANASNLLVLSATYHLDPAGRNNSFVAAYLTGDPLTPGENATIVGNLDLMAPIVPNRKVRRGRNVRRKTTLYTYLGSLTTPTCDQGVTWLVIDANQGPTISVPQLEDFQVLVSNISVGDPINNRLPNPLKGRKVRKFRAFL